MTTTTTSSVRTGCAIPGGRYNIFFVESIAIVEGALIAFGPTYSIMN